ncbi:MAG: thymidine kinase [Phycisphaerales bacterium]|nr:thymidine kinase [Phycisphaerales bacterium]
MTDPASPRLEVICGPMFAGKSTELIRRLSGALAAGRRVRALKPHIDTRYHATHIATHDGRLLPASTIARPEELLDAEGDLVGLDEAHFFRSGLHDAVRRLLGRGTSVVLAGLDRTSLNEPFGEMAALLVEADEVVKLTAPCAVCGQPAVHTIRLFDSKEDIVVGGAGMFENRCRRHLIEPRPTALRPAIPPSRL